MRCAAIISLVYYGLGVLLLPGGDFRTLADLPEMYALCKATEDHDMTLVDFITDHLLPLDSLVDHHPPGDAQRPHAPPVSDHAGIAPFTPLPSPPSMVGAATPLAKPTSFTVADNYAFDPLIPVFRPPAA